jgi:hypothetical protein
MFRHIIDTVSRDVADQDAFRGGRTNIHTIVSNAQAHHTTALFHLTNDFTR